MKNVNGNGENDFLLTFSDLLHVIKKRQRTIVKMALICALIALGYGLTRPIEYRVEATFKEKGKSQSGLNQSLSALLLSADTNDSDALMMMRSRMLIEQLVKSQGLQAVITKKDASIFFKRITDNLLGEYANIKALNRPIITPTHQQITAEEVKYHGESPIELSLAFYSDDDFNIFALDGQLLGESRFGSPFSTDQLAFTLQKTSPNVTVDKNYRLTLQPLGKTAQSIAKKFTIETDRFDSSMIKIAYRHPDKYQAVAHTNTLMNLYAKHTHQEHQRVCNLQIAYLQKKQADMGKQLEELMHTHANNLSSDLSNTGFADYTTAMNFLTSNQHHYKQRLQAIDLETHWLNQAQNEGKDGCDKFTSSQNPDVINQLTKDLRQLKHEANSLELALRKFEPVVETDSSNSLSKSFQGIDLNTAKELYLSYSKELNALEAQTAQLNFIISQIHLPDFEISSLSTVLADPISTEMISKASQIILALKDQDNRTHKEQERLKAGLSIHKGFFLTHLGQTSQLIQLRQELMKEKIKTLQNAHHTLILEQISILENQMADYMAQRLKALQREKDLHIQNLSDLRSEMASLPQKWVAEQMIQQQMEINQNMIEQISKLVESKNLTSNLEKTQSTPVDLPLIPIHPQPPHLLLLSLIGALTGAFLGTAWALAQSIGKGVGASIDNLRLAGQHVSGTISLNSSLGSLSPSSAILDGDLNTLRRIISFITSAYPQTHTHNTLLLLCNHGPKYAEILADLMFKMGFKVLIIDLCLETIGTSVTESRKDSLLQYLEGNIELPYIENTACCDIISSGGISRFSNEMFASEKFDHLLKKLQPNYDWVIGTSQISPLCAETETLLGKFSKAVITINGESLQELRASIVDHKNINNITFVILSEPGKL